MEIKADLVVLATAVRRQPGAEELAQKLHVSYDAYKFFAEAHPKLRPVETNTAGIFLAGACQAPKDIPETVAQASGAAAKVCGLFSQAELIARAGGRRGQPPARRRLFDLRRAASCARRPAPTRPSSTRRSRGRDGKLIKTVAKVNPGLCQGCGTCVAFCRSKSIDLQGFTNEQVYAEVMALLNRGEQRWLISNPRSSPSSATGAPMPAPT